MTEAEQLEAIRLLLELHLSWQGFGLGLGLGIVSAGTWMLAGFLRKIFNDIDE